MSLKRLALPLFCLCLSNVSGVMAQQGVQVRSHDGMLSVQANNTSAGDLAQVLSEQLGISVVVTGDADTRVNIDIVEEPLAKALAKLSPNHLLVRSNDLPNSEIIEVVLMMGDDDGSGNGGGEEQFLPSGSPADDIVVTEEDLVNEDGTPMRDPNRMEQVREAAEATPDAASSQEAANSMPAADSFDPVTGLPIDPNTGLPVE